MSIQRSKYIRGLFLDSFPRLLVYHPGTSYVSAFLTVTTPRVTVDTFVAASVTSASW